MNPRFPVRKLQHIHDQCHFTGSSGLDVVADYCNVALKPWKLSWWWLWNAHNNMTTAMYRFNLISWQVVGLNVGNMVHCWVCYITTAGCMSKGMWCAFTVDVCRQLDRYHWHLDVDQPWYLTMLAWQQRSLPQSCNLTSCPTSCYLAAQIAIGLERDMQDWKMNVQISLTKHREAWQNICLLG